MDDNDNEEEGNPDEVPINRPELIDEEDKGSD